VTTDAKYSHNDILEIAGAADRAGSIVTDQVRSIIENAEQRAAEIRRHAEDDARKTREAAYEVATEVLERIDALGGPLAELVNDLRAEAERLAAPISSERASGD
jgi:vacuolar-type H+-ATPase subunit H